MRGRGEPLPRRLRTPRSTPPARLAGELDVAGVAVNDGFERGGEGAVELAEAVVEAAATGPQPPRFLYALDRPDRAEDRGDRARAPTAPPGVELSPAARAQAERFERDGLGGLPICMAKTHLSLSHDPTLIGAPTGFTLPVRELRPYTGAGWIVAVCGDMQTMPGLPAKPAALRIDLDADGHTVGLR